MAQNKFIWIAGICTLENEEICLETAKTLKAIADKYNVDFYYKGSFDKANRATMFAPRGPGLEEGKRILRSIHTNVGCKTTTDVHESYQPALLEEAADLIQIPAFLSRQTDLLVAAAKTGYPVSVKKGPFMSADEIGNTVVKLEESGCKKIILIERGQIFGYGRLIVDMTNVSQMKKYGYPVLVDVTHTAKTPGVVIPGQSGSGGNAGLIPYIAKASVAAGADGVFMEVHPTPECALCDGPNSVRLSEVEPLLQKLLAIWEIVKNDD